MASNIVHVAAVHLILPYASFNEGMKFAASAGMGVTVQTTMISLISVKAIAVDRFVALKMIGQSRYAIKMAINVSKINRNALLVVGAIWVTCSLVGVAVSIELVKRKTFGYLILLLFIVTFIWSALV